MKHIHKETVLLGAVLVIAVGLFAGALMLGERLSSPVSGLCFGAAGILGGVAGSRLSWRAWNGAGPPRSGRRSNGGSGTSGM